MPFNPPLIPTDISTALPHFSEISALSEGGQGAVFRARARNGSSVALKIYFSENTLERTAREVAALQAIQNEHLVRIHGYGKCQMRDRECVWLATEFINGEPLAQRLASGRRSVAEVIQIVAGIARAIEALWTARIVHRDIKPDNVMIAEGGRAVLIDLGVARHTNLTPLTATGSTWGTTGYLSPEQMRATRALTCKSDIFALGILAQECLLGRHPTGRQQAPLAHGGPSTRGLVAGIPDQMVGLIDSMVRRHPHERPLPSVVIRTANLLGSHGMNA